MTSRASVDGLNRRDVMRKLRNVKIFRLAMRRLSVRIVAKVTATIDAIKSVH